MTRFRILHGDGDPQMREIVRISLAVDPAISVVSCANGNDVAALAVELMPNLILCDVIIPGLEGAALLRRLAGSVGTKSIPVILTAACGRPSGIAHWKSLGVTAVIVKPYDRAHLAQTVRHHLIVSRFAAANGSFSSRLRADFAALELFRNASRVGRNSPAALSELLSRVHKLAGAAGVFGFRDVSLTASALEETIIDNRAGCGAASAIEANLDALLNCIKQDSGGTHVSAGVGSRRGNGDRFICCE